MNIPNLAMIKAHRDWGTWYRNAEYNLIFFEDWLEEKWGIDLSDYYKHSKPKGFYLAWAKDEGKAALFMLKYYDKG